MIENSSFPSWISFLKWKECYNGLTFTCCADPNGVIKKDDNGMLYTQVIYIKFLQERKCIHVRVLS